MSVASMCREIITIVKQDGNIIENVKAMVQSGKIIIPDGKLPIEEQDIIYRSLPSGLVESYVINDRGYIAGISGIEGFYQALVTKENTIKQDQYQNIINVYNLHGENSKVNVNSIDNSVNMIKDNKEVFDKLISIINEQSDEKIRNQAIALAIELKENIGKPSFIDRYKELIALMADQISIIAPLLPALTALIR